MDKIIIKNTSQEEVKRLIININGDTKGFKVPSIVLTKVAKDINTLLAEDLK